MQTLLDKATEDEIEIYTHGSCHVFAIALCQLYGFRPVIVMDEDGRNYESAETDKDLDDEDDGIFQHNVIHVYAEDPKTDKLYDIQGIRDNKDIYQEVEDLFCSCTLSHIDYGQTIKDLDHYIDNGNDTGPLHPVSQEEINDARVIAIRLFGEPEPEKKPDSPEP